MNPYLKQYKQTQINTTPKEQILLMLYDGAVRFLHLAKEGFAEKNIEQSVNCELWKLNFGLFII